MIIRSSRMQRTYNIAVATESLPTTYELFTFTPNFLTIDYFFLSFFLFSLFFSFSFSFFFLLHPRPFHSTSTFTLRISPFFSLSLYTIHLSLRSTSLARSFFLFLLTKLSLVHTTYHIPHARIRLSSSFLGLSSLLFFFFFFFFFFFIDIVMCSFRKDTQVIFHHSF